MSYFSNALKIVIEERALTQRAFADLADFDSGLLNRYIAGTVRPGREVLEKICRALEAPRHRAAIVAAHLRDEIPPSAEELVQVINLVLEPHSVVQEPGTAAKLPAKARADFAFLMKHAEKHPEVLGWIRATVDVISAR